MIQQNQSKAINYPHVFVTMSLWPFFNAKIPCVISNIFNMNKNDLIFTRGQFWPSGIVIACVCVSVRVSVCVYQSLACPHDNSSAVHARITKFG